MIQVILVEDHNVVRNGIRLLLDTDSDINIAFEAAQGKQVLDYLNSGGYADMILTDINMPEMDGISLLKEVKRTHPTVKILMLSMHDHELYIQKAFQKGASGYLLKSVSTNELIFAIKHINNGGKYLGTELTMNLLERKPLTGRSFVEKEELKVEFSIREAEVLQLIAEGMTNLEMADKLFVSKRTIEGYRQAMIEKSGVRNTAALIRYALLNGILKSSS
ncbi:response regulator transcription factor [Pedobacter sp. N36a]|uniref:response regulator transcription factor n=1 Tax=Pedobacter sp. N36a TaxID=2767996 RepID=UPI0016574B12|nr:response regulator transcription factor [Pedobacter sp. N36a]MBC8986342.1 response regulator transcription factor [Pedobacter sp. N36a]